METKVEAAVAAVAPPEEAAMTAAVVKEMAETAVVETAREPSVVNEERRE